jgi:hypothetical protein
MTLGLAARQADLSAVRPSTARGGWHWARSTEFCGGECLRLFPDEMFADLFDDAGRRSVPPMIVAVVMVLQRIEGCNDRQPVDRVILAICMTTVK